MRFPITILGVLPVTIASAVQTVQHEDICSYSAHLFIDVLAKVGYVKNATSVAAESVACEDPRKS
jgi:hypothetical protein